MSDELIVIEREDALKAFTDEQAFDAMFNQIKTLAEEVKPDLTSAKGRKEHKSFCFKIRKTKARIDDVRTDLTEDMRKQIAAINERGKAMVERLEDLHTTVRQPLTDWEEAEKLRVDTIRKAIEDARSLGQVRFGETSRQIQDRMDKLPTHDLDWYAEFKDEADLVIQAAFNGLSIAKTAALNAEKEAAEREAERAELARLKRAEEERLAKERAAEEERKAEEARREQEKREADEKVAAERAAAEQKQAELQRQLDEANRKAADAEKAAQDAEERAAKAAEDERRRQDEERYYEAERAEEARVKAEQQAEEDRRAAEKRELNIEATNKALHESAEDLYQIWSTTVADGKTLSKLHSLATAIYRGEVRHIRFEA